MNPIITYLLDKAPAIVALFVVGFIVWKVAGFYFTRFQKTEDKVNSLPCGQHKDQISEAGEILGATRQTLNTLVDNTDSINSMVSEISVWIMKKDKQIASLYHK